MVDENEEELARRKKQDEGEGDQDSWGRGKAGAASGGIKISARMEKEIRDAWHHLVSSDLVVAIGEFFSEALRASANLSVTWEKTMNNSKSFAVIDWAIEFGKKAGRELARTRDRIRSAGRDSRTLQSKKPVTNPGMKQKPSSGPNTR